jgi:hypothetical protein
VTTLAGTIGHEGNASDVPSCTECERIARSLFRRLRCARALLETGDGGEGGRLKLDGEFGASTEVDGVGDSGRCWKVKERFDVGGDPWSEVDGDEN